jgi:hypothetical protein
MQKIAFLYTFSVILLVKVASQKTSEYYYDYYDDEYTAEDKVVLDNTEQYDVSELVKAWKEYIKEKTIKATEDEENYDCPPQSDSYRIPDAAQCDKYLECNIKGEESIKLCPDGLMFEIKQGRCDYPAKVNCTGRPLLQTANPSKNCPRENGFFPFPANESCQKFWDCRGGKSYLQICPEAVIFDSFIDACVTPDQAKRKDCLAAQFLGFECPQYKPDDVLRFGNHDRLPSPKNCQQFFSCLKSGEPRLGACPRNTVFSPETGHCADPKSVLGCETFWKDKLADSEDYSYYD